MVSCILLVMLVIRAIALGLYVEYSRPAVAKIFVQGHMPIMKIVGIPVFLVTLLIAVSSYEVYTLTLLPHIFTWTNLYIWHLMGIFVVGTCIPIAW